MQCILQCIVCFQSVHRWLDANGLCLNPDKSEAIVIGTSARQRSEPKIKDVTVAGYTCESHIRGNQVTIIDRWELTYCLSTCLEPHALWPLFCIILPNSIHLKANYFTAVEGTPILSIQQECSPDTLLYTDTQIIGFLAVYNL